MGLPYPGKDISSLMRQDHDSCLIEPRRGRNEDPLPHSAILVFNPEDLRTFQDCFTHPVSKTHKVTLADVFAGEFNGTPIALAGPMLGAPQTILVLERMIALGARHVIAMGWCGSLQAHINIGDIVLPSGAISEEGTSRHYPESAPTPFPSPYAIPEAGAGGIRPAHSRRDRVDHGCSLS